MHTAGFKEMIEPVSSGRAFVTDWCRATRRRQENVNPSRRAVHLPRTGQRCFALEPQFVTATGKRIEVSGKRRINLLALLRPLISASRQRNGT
jgi:hypothetical protein